MSSFDRATKIFSGRKFPQIFHPKVPLGQVLLYQCLKNPDKVIQLSADDGIRITCEKMSEMMTQVAEFLIDSGMKFGDSIGFCAANTTFLAPAVHGCVLLGLPITAVDISMKANAIFNVFQQTKPKLIFCDRDQVLKLQEVFLRLKRDVKFVILTDEILGHDHISKCFEREVSPSRIPSSFNMDNEKICVAILASSGSTGAPKLVRFTQAQMLESLYSFSGFHNNLLLLNFFNLFSGCGINPIIHTILNQHTRLITKEKFSPELCIDLVEKFNVTQLTILPSEVKLLTIALNEANKCLPSVKMLSTGGWFISAQDIKETESKLPNGRLRATYGTSETNAITFACSDGTVSPSLGKLCLNTQVKILKADQTLGEIGDVGEILIKRKFNIIDYLNNEKATKDFLDDDLWMHTGDMGYFDPDLNLFIVGRKKFVIRCCNHLVYPTEIEEAIEVLPAVAKVCVVAIADYDSYEAPCAIVVKVPGSSLTGNDVKNAVAHLEDYKQLKCGVFFVEDLPLTTSGKIDRNAVEKIALLLAGK